MFTLSGENVQYQPLLSTLNENTKIKKYDHNTLSDMTKQTILSSHQAITWAPSLISVLDARIKKAGWMR